MSYLLELYITFDTQSSLMQPIKQSNNLSVMP